MCTQGVYGGWSKSNRSARAVSLRLKELDDLTVRALLGAELQGSPDGESGRGQVNVSPTDCQDLGTAGTSHASEEEWDAPRAAFSDL